MPRSRPRKGCAPCHPRWDQGPSDSGPSAATRRRRPAGVGPAGRAARPEPAWTFSTSRRETAPCRSTGALPDVEGPDAGRGRFGGEAVQRGPGRPRRGDDGRPAKRTADRARVRTQSGVKPVQAPRPSHEASVRPGDPTGPPPRTWGRCPARTRARAKASPAGRRCGRLVSGQEVVVGAAGPHAAPGPARSRCRGHRCPRPRRRPPPHHPLIPKRTGKGAAPEPYGTVRGSPFTCSGARCALTRPSSGSGRRRLPPARSAGRRAVPTSPRHGR